MQGSRKAHQAGNQKHVTKLKSEYEVGLNYFLELTGHHGTNNTYKDHQQCPHLGWSNQELPICTPGRAQDQLTKNAISMKIAIWKAN